MKTIVTLIAASLLAVTAFADIDCDVIFIHNEKLPPDCVELAWTAYNAGAKDCIYSRRGEDQPAEPTTVQVAVFTVAPDGAVIFVGWSWMFAEEVNELHSSVVANL